MAAGVLLTTAVVVLLGMGATNAWYAYIRSAQEHSTAITTAASNISLEGYRVYSYKYLGNERVPGSSQVVKKSQFRVSYSADTAVLDMFPYDAVLNHNEKTPVIYRIPVKGTGIAEGDRFTVTVSNSGVEWLGDQGELLNIISNILQVQCAVIPAADIDTTTEETIWQSAVQYFAENPDPQTFVNVNDKAASLSFDVRAADLNNHTFYVYLMMDYNTELIRRYAIENHFTSRLGAAQSLISFVTDVANIDISPVTGN